MQVRLVICLTSEVQAKSYYMAVSHKDWEIPNSRICLAEIDSDRSLDLPI